MNQNPSPLTFAERMELQRQNRSRFETYRDMAGEQLPAPVVVATPERVYVTVADADDLAVWLTVYGGSTHRSASFDGMQVWTLHQVSRGWSDGRAVPVQISAVVHEGEPVMHELLDVLVATPPVQHLSTKQTTIEPAKSNKAAFLARKFAEERAVVTAVAIDETTVDLTVQPASLDEWAFWQRRFHVEPGQSTYRGSYATAKGMFGSSVQVLLTGLGVGALYAAEQRSAVAS